MEPPVITNLELGRRGTVSMAEVLALGYVLNVPPLQLVFPVGRVAEMELLPGEVYPPYTAFWLAERAGIFGGGRRQPIETTVPSRLPEVHQAQNEWNRTLHQPRVDMRVVDAYVELMRSYRGHHAPRRVDPSATSSRARLPG